MTQENIAMTNEEYNNVFTGTSEMLTGMPNMASTMATQMGRSRTTTRFRHL